jgi:hypothetical protein
VTVGALTIRGMALSGRKGRLPRTSLIIACVAVDAVAAGILFFGTPPALSLVGLVAAVVHGIAAVVLCGAPDARPSRRWFGVAATLAVPVVGVAVAAAIFVTRGSGSIAMRRRKRARRRSVPTIAAMQRLVGALSPRDALDGGDEEQRRAALSALSGRDDPEAIALLRHAAASRDPDLALSAALVLDKIGERAERKVVRLDPVEARYEAS